MHANTFVYDFYASDPEESFTLSRYKAVSGFSCGKIKLFLIPESTSFQHRIDRIKNCIEELDDDELSSCELDELTQDKSSMNELLHNKCY